MLFMCLPCFAGTSEILQNLINQEQDFLHCKTDCNFKMNNLYKQLIEQVPLASKDINTWNIVSDENLNYTLYPITDLIYFSPNEWIGIWINYKHLKAYSNLSKEWKEYLNVYNDSDTMDLIKYQGKNGIEFIKRSNNFIKKYPNFPFNYYLKEQQDIIIRLVCGQIPDISTNINNVQTKTFCKYYGY